MGHCETCGNEYDKTFEVVKDGATHTFDSFRMRHSSAAPTCRQCGCRIIGRGEEGDKAIFCCSNCAQQAGVAGLADRR